MRRADRQQDLAFAQALIDRCEYGVVSMLQEDAAPYCVPLSMVRLDNCLYFHCALEGKKVDLLRRNPKVCVCFVGDTTPSQTNFTAYYQSAVATGQAVEVEGKEEKIHALRALSEKLTPALMGGDAFARYVDKALSVTSVWRIDIEELTAKANFAPPTAK